MVDLKNIIKNAESANKEFHDGYPPPPSECIWCITGA